MPVFEVLRPGVGCARPIETARSFILGVFRNDSRSQLTSVKSTNMAKRVTGPEIEKLIQLLAKVPGLGPRSARRAALHLVKKKDQLLGPLASAMADAHQKVRICSACGNVDTVDPCTVCTDERR